MDRLFTRARAPRRPRRTGGVAVVPWPTPHLCPLCAAPLNTDPGAASVALFYLYGYGAVIRTTWRTCPCGYRRHWRTETISPRE